MNRANRPLYAPPHVARITCEACKNFAWTRAMGGPVVDSGRSPHHPSCPKLRRNA